MREMITMIIWNILIWIGGAYLLIWVMKEMAKK